MENKDSVILHLKNKVITVYSDGIDSSLDVDDLLQIDYSNLFAESISIPVALNKIGQLRSEANAICEHKKLDFDIFRANRARDYRLKAKDNGEKITDKGLEERIINDPAYKIERKNLINAQKDAEFCDSLYQAVRSKERQLSNLTRNIIPEEHISEIVEKKINTCLIKVHERKFKES